MLYELLTEADTKQFAGEIASEIGNKSARGYAIGIIGDLGAGKTTFCRYFSEALGVEGGIVSSPSYVLEHEYRTSLYTIEHWDLYRLGELPEELEEPPGPEVIRLIEWVNRVPRYYEQLDLLLEFSFSKERNEGRRVRVDSNLGLAGNEPV